MARIQWDNFSEAFPAFLTIVATPLTFSVATGLSLGVLSFIFVKVGSGRYREVSPLIWILMILFILRCAFHRLGIGLKQSRPGPLLSF